MTTKFVLIETTGHEQHEVEVHGIFDIIEDALEFVEHILWNYGYEPDSHLAAMTELETKHIHKIDRRHYFHISKAPVNPIPPVPTYNEAEDEAEDEDEGNPEEDTY